jgi:hypothetical protein
VEAARLAPVELDGEHSASNTSFIGPILETRATEPELDPRAVDDAAEALFEEARRRARRRRRRAAAIAAALLASAGVLAAIVATGRERHWSADRGPYAVPAAPEQLLTQGPYMGVSCRVPNSVACDRIGLAVWTRRFARSVVATIGDRTFTLDDPTWSGPAKHGLRRFFAGFLDHAGLTGDGPLGVEIENGGSRWTGVKPVVVPTVRLVLVLPDGSRRSTELRVDLAPGWG